MSTFPPSSPYPGNQYGSPYGNQPGGQFGNPYGAPNGGLPMRPSYPGQPTQPNHPRQKTRRSQMRLGLTYAVGYVVLIWAVHIINVFLFGGTLTAFGIHPLDVSSLPYIFTSPILHVNFEHLMSNTVPGAIFAFLIGYSGSRVFWEVTAFVVALGGVGVWFFGGLGTNHIGASMLVYGWLGYLLVRGIFNRSASQIVLGVVLGLSYSGLVWGVLPLTPGVSWQAHLFGALGGIAAGVIITSDDPPALAAKKQQKKALKQSSRRMR